MTATRIDRGSTDTTTIYSEGGDLTYERIFEAPREAVWRANTDPELIPHARGARGRDVFHAQRDERGDDDKKR